MKLRFLLAAAVLLGTTSAARAQVGLYLNPFATNVSNSVVDNSVFGFLGPDSTSRTFWGVNLGGYYDFYHSGKFTVGGDIRWDDARANNAVLKEFLVGVRFSGQPFKHPWRPYFEAAGGEGSTKAPHSAISERKPDYRFLGGVDYPIAKHVDVRVIEVGWGRLKTISSATVGNGGNVAIPASNMLSFSSGLVFRF
jgi:hypothetical protein